MGFREKLASLIRGKSGEAGDEAVHIYVECGRCGAKVRVRLDKRHDLSQHEDGGYYVRKEIMDSKCFRLMAAELTFDGAYHIRSQEIQGGRFLSREEFQADPPPSPPAASR